MVRRAQDWNINLAKRLRDRSFARNFIIAAFKESLPIQVALGKAIRAYGIKEFAELIDMPPSILIRAFRPSTNPTLETITRLLAPFGLTLSVAERASKKRKAA